MTLKIIDGEFAVCKVSALSDVRTVGGFWFLAQTDEEISLVCSAEMVPDRCSAVESGWRMFRVEGPLDFSLTGILARLSGALAEAGISIFAVSTFNTDYILVKSEHFERAAEVLRAAGHAFNLE